MTLERKIKLIEAMKASALKEYITAINDELYKSAAFNQGYAYALDNVLDILNNEEFTQVLIDTYMKGE